MTSYKFQPGDTFIDEHNHTGTIIDFDEWLLEHKRERLLPQTPKADNDPNKVFVKYNQPFSGVYYHCMPYSYIKLVTKYKAKCKHEWITIFTSVECKHCGKPKYFMALVRKYFNLNFISPREKILTRKDLICYRGIK